MRPPAVRSQPARPWPAIRLTHESRRWLDDERDCGRPRPRLRLADHCRHYGQGVRHGGAESHPAIRRGAWCPHLGGRGSHAEGRQPRRVSTRLNSSHVAISYAVFCLKKKKTIRLVNHFHTVKVNNLERNKPT